MQSKTKPFSRTLYIVLAVLLVGGLSFLFTQSDFLKGSTRKPSGAEQEQGSIVLSVGTEYFDPDDVDPASLITDLTKDNFRAESAAYRGINAFEAVPFLFEGIYELGVVNDTMYKVTANVDGYVSASETFLSCTDGTDCTADMGLLSVPTANAEGLTYTGNLLALDYAYKVILHYDESEGTPKTATVTAGDLSDAGTPTTCSYQDVIEEWDTRKIYYDANGSIVSPTTPVFDPDSYLVFTCPVPLATTAFDYKVSLSGYLTLTGSFKADRTANSNAQQIIITDVFTAGTDPVTPAGVTVTEVSGTTTVTEGSTTTDSYTVVLDAAPNAPVTVTVTPDAQVTVSPSTLTFTRTNWDTAQTVTVTAVDDSTVETRQTGTITHTATSTDTSYSGIRIAKVTAKITDNDTATAAGVTVTESSGTTAVTEGSTTTDSYTLVLNTAPSADVVITVTPDAQVTVSPSTITFTSTTWATAQTVTVTAVDDTTVEGTHSGVIKHTATSADHGSSGVSIASVTATITDNDTATAAGVTITQSNSTTAVTEGGSTDTYTVVLNTAPTSDVSVTVTPDSQVTVSNATLTFTSTTWATAQTVTVTAVDDTTSETSQTGTIKHTATSTDTSYSGITVASVTATITDNDSTDPFSVDYVCEDPFVDNTEEWSKDFICRMYQLGYISGRESDLVVANDEMTRAEWVKVMVLVYGFDPDTDADDLTTEFTDVSEDDWFYEYIVIAEDEDAIRIRDAGTEFRPNDPIDRAFALVVAARMGGLTSTSYDVEELYNDVNNSDYFAYILAIASEKTVDVPVTQADGTVIMEEDVPVIGGYEDGSFRPYNYMARSEAMALGFRIALAWGVAAE